MLNPQVTQFFRQIPVGRRVLALVWKAAGWWVVVWMVLLVFQGVIPAGLALLLRTLVNHLVSRPQWATALSPALGIAGLWVVSQILSSAVGWVRAVLAELIEDEVQRRVHLQALRLDLAFYDNPESYDLLHRAKFDAISQPLVLLENLGSLLQNSLGFLVLAGILFSYARWLPALLILTAVPGLFLVTRHILKEHQWHLDHTIEERRAGYLNAVIVEQSTAAELRLFGLGSYHRQAFERIRDGLRQGKLLLVREGAFAELSAGLLAWAGSLFGLGWMLYETIAGDVKLGDLLLCLTAFQSGQSQLRSLLDGAGKIYRSLLFVEGLEDFLEIEPKILPSRCSESGLPVRQAIRFDHVSFAYPGALHRALDDFNLVIPNGKIVALVGHNGAGKSTLVKLLCRFYDPDGGRILLDGTDLRDVDPEALRRHITVLFQDPVQYNATVRENIAFGNIAALSDQEALRHAAQAAGALDPIERLGEGFDTVLGKWFGTTELSIGEWQRVALARAFFRDAPLIILDEPTSAMDSWAEQDWLSRFRALAAGKTALMITHRFTTAMYADVIHVVHKGRVLESGTHAELVERGGMYSSSWSAQTRELARD